MLYLKVNKHAKNRFQIVSLVDLEDSSILSAFLQQQTTEYNTKIIFHFSNLKKRNMTI
jgi:hypothetical protein